MTAPSCMPEKQEALQRLSAATDLGGAAGTEADLEIARQAAALRAAFVCRFFTLLGTALHRAAEELATPPVSAGASRY